MGIKVQAEKRDVFGKNASRRLRREGSVPAVLYGESTQSVSLTLNKKEIFSILKSETGENTLFKVGFDSELRDAMIKEFQVDPTTDELLHVDLIQISMDKVIRVSVPVETVGEAVGVKTEGGFIDFITREVEIECLPKDIPEHLNIDISGLHLHQSVKAGDLDLPAGVELITEPGTVLVLVEVPHKEEEKKEEEEEEAVVVEEKEPEVIKKERAEDKGKEKEE